MGTEKISLTGASETTLATLYGKAMESRLPNSVLRDREADRAMRRVDYDFSRLRMSKRDQISAAVRAKGYDEQVARYLRERPECTVLHLGCGLDTRGHRLAPPTTARWYDVDFPDVIDLRRRLFPDDPHRVIASSVTDPHLLDRVPGDLPVLVVAEGLTPYLRAADGVALLNRIVGHFPGGTLVFDGYSRVGVRLLQRLQPAVRASGARLEWAIGDPHELERTVPGLVFDREWWFADVPDIQRHYSRSMRELTKLFFAIPALRHLGRGLTFHFTRADG